MSGGTRRAAAALVLDVGAVALFVAIGRSVHTHGLSVAGMASTAWPFLSGLAAGWLVVTTRGHGAASVVDGIPVWISTVALGMVLRVLSGQGTATAFVFVALGFLGAVMLGGRAVFAAVRRLWTAASPAGDGDCAPGWRGRAVGLHRRS